MKKNKITKNIKICFALCSLSMTTAYAQAATTGEYPIGRMVPGIEPNIFYGNASYAGASNTGVVYSYNASTGTYTDIINLNFTPSGNPVVASDGSIYVIAQNADNSGNNPYGALYHIVNGNIILNHSFTNSNCDGANPNFITLMPDGKIVGTTLNGGWGYGTIFQYNPIDGSFPPPQFFVGTNGKRPFGVIYANGYLYGVTENGGSSNNGVLYRLTYPFNSPINILHNFTGNGSDGSNPADLLTISNDGNTIMGTTLWGSSQGTKYTSSSGSTFSYSIPNNQYLVVWIDDFLQPTSPVQAADGYWYQSVIDGNDNWDILAFSDDGTKSNIGPATLFSGANSTNNQGRNFQNIPINGLTYNPANNTYLGTQQWNGANGFGYINQFQIANWWITSSDVYDFK
jgi:uncharacterized repeat protein (TIGR03803 family)